MSNVVMSRSAPPGSPARPGATRIAAIVLVFWFTLVFLLGAQGAFVSPPGTLPVPIGIGVLAPLVAFFAALQMSRRFREFVLAADVRLMMAIQAWRFAGLGFVALYVHGVLPGIFAWPAGLGDVAIGLSAPWMLAMLMRQPGFAASGTFVAWNVLGILDLVVAVGVGTAVSSVASGIAGEITTAPMTYLPLVIIPAFLVPAFIMLHTAALMQARRLAEHDAIPP